MTEPPPERPLPDQARARMRAELLAHAHEHRSRAPRWAVPLSAAAAVALVAGVSWWAVAGVGADTGSTPVTGGGTPSGPASAPITPDATPPAPVGSPEDAESTIVGTGTCEVEMEDVLRGATLAFRFDEATSFWVKGDRFVQCDQLAGRTTVHRDLPLTPRDGVATYAVSTLLNDQGAQTRSAGGIVPPGAEAVFDVAYTFQDGHTERATTGTDAEGRTWWHLRHTYTAQGNELEQPPIEVVVSLSGVQRTYELRPGVDTCAQANHGC